MRCNIKVVRTFVLVTLHKEASMDPACYLKNQVYLCLLIEKEFCPF